MRTSIHLKSTFYKVVTLFVTIALSSCLNKVDENLFKEDTEAYAAAYNNYKEIKVDIQTAYPNQVYSIYLEQPYEEGSLVETPFLLAKTPINTTLKVPKGTDSLYVVSSGEMVRYKVQDIHINSTSSRSFSTTIMDKIVNVVNNKYFPESSNNVWGDDLYKCTDLVIAQSHGTADFDKANVWVTYITDGGFNKAGLYGKLWFYTYPSDKMNTLTAADCTFYGMESNGTIVPVTYASISNKHDNKSDRGEKHILWSWVDQPKANNKNYTRVHLGSFEKGLNIGFVFRGTNERCQFSTPKLNLSEGKDHTYIGTTITHRKDKSKKMTLTKEVSNGFLCHIVEDEFEIKVLGMDNRTPNSGSYDGDYNDMLCLIETDPVKIETADEIIPSEIEEYVLEKGIYLFEDNYPQQGDYDFNDVVVEYEIKSFVNGSASKGKRATNRLLAYGSNYVNEFGYKESNSDNYIKVFEGVVGRKNVHQDSYSETGILEVVTQLPNTEVRPYLHNGKGYIIDANYNQGLYPYVLIIPSTNSAASNFRWCVESKRIDEAYSFTAPRADDWYLQPTDAALVINRK